MGLAAEAADGLLADLVPATTPTFLQPGLCARYDLRRFIDEMFDRAVRLDGAAVVLVAPAVDDGGQPSIRGNRDTLPLPGLLPGSGLCSRCRGSRTSTTAPRNHTVDQSTDLSRASTRHPAQAAGPRRDPRFRRAYRRSS